MIFIHGLESIFGLRPRRHRIKNNLRYSKNPLSANINQMSGVKAAVPV